MLSLSVLLLSLAATGLGWPLADPKPPALTYLYTVNLTSPAPINVGAGPRGIRQVIPISGGAFSGPKLSGG